MLVRIAEHPRDVLDAARAEDGQRPSTDDAAVVLRDLVQHRGVLRGCRRGAAGRRAGRPSARTPSCALRGRTPRSSPRRRRRADGRTHGGRRRQSSIVSLSPRREASTMNSMADSLHIAFVASEMAPFAKTGGLADVIGALPKALAALGHRVTVFLPALRLHRLSAGAVPGRHAGAAGRRPAERRAISSASSADRVRVIFVDYAPFFGRPNPYGDGGGDYGDNRLRFAFFARAVLEFFRSPRRAPRRLPRPRLAGGPAARLPEVVLLDGPARSTARRPCSPSTTWPTRGTSPPTRWPSSACPGTSARAKRGSSSTAASAS